MTNFPAVRAAARPRRFGAARDRLRRRRRRARPTPPLIAASRADRLKSSPHQETLPMSIFSRTRDIIAANVTDLLDHAEDPAKMIRMIIMEMEETLVEVRAGAARTIADQKEMRRAVARAEAAQASWAEKAELALSKGREDLATAALLEKAKAKSFADATLRRHRPARRGAERQRGGHPPPRRQAARGAPAAEHAADPDRERQLHGRGCARCTRARGSRTPSPSSRSSSAAPTSPRAMPTPSASAVPARTLDDEFADLKQDTAFSPSWPR